MLVGVRDDIGEVLGAVADLFSPGRGQAYAKVRLGIDQPTFMI